jgi:Rad3-related DNA helicase
MLNLFKNTGGVMLACGMAEGVDLKGDLCHVNIIPKLQFSYLGDPWVQKRKELHDGDLWYSLATVKWMLQAAGRSTRSEKDYSEIYILDQAFGGLVMRTKKHIPRYFMEAIKWTR